MSDRDGLRRRADVLQRVADQLSAQLRVERWSNAELRHLLGEPACGRDFEDDRLASRRFLTFAMVAVATAAAVALLASSPWHGHETLPITPMAEAPMPVVGSALGGTIIPFTVVGDTALGDPSPPRVQRSRPRPIEPADIEAIFGRPASRVRLTPPSARRHRSSLVISSDEIFGTGPSRSVVDVP